MYSFKEFLSEMVLDEAKSKYVYIILKEKNINNFKGLILESLTLMRIDKKDIITRKDVVPPLEDRVYYLYHKNYKNETFGFIQNAVGSDNILLTLKPKILEKAGLDIKEIEKNARVLGYKFL